MQRASIITLSGKPGSGKSSTADKVAEMLGFTRYSSGDFVRNYIRKHRLSLAEFNAKARDNHKLDEVIDEELRQLRNQKDIVIDSRLGFYWIPESFKVYLDLDMDVATVRIFRDAVSNADRSNELATGTDIHDVRKNVTARLNTEMRRFKRLYGVNPYDTKNFDLIINTSRHTPQTVALTVFDNYKKWLRTDEWQPVHSEVPMGYSFSD